MPSLEYRKVWGVTETPEYTELEGKVKEKVGYLQFASFLRTYSMIIKYTFVDTLIKYTFTHLILTNMKQTKNNLIFLIDIILY